MAGGHGGRRSGAGRKPGISPVKALRSIVGTERDPLMVAVGIAADPANPAPLRLEAALGAAPYLHPPLSAQAVAAAQTVLAAAARGEAMPAQVAHAAELQIRSAEVHLVQVPGEPA